MQTPCLLPLMTAYRMPAMISNSNAMSAMFWITRPDGDLGQFVFVDHDAEGEHRCREHDDQGCG